MAEELEGLDPIVEPRRAVDQVADRLREAIISGRIPPGSKLPEPKLAAQFRVSRIPVREALSRLQAEGLVKRSPYRGTVVALPTVAQVAESFMLRALVEGFAAKLATHRISATDISELRGLITRIDECARAGRIQELPALHHRFHSIIYMASGSPKLVSWIEDLYNQFPRSRTRTVRVEEPTLEYERIVAALEARDAELAGKLMSEHLDRGGEAITRYYAELLSAQDCSV